MESTSTGRATATAGAGLDDGRAAARLVERGPNQLPEPPAPRLWRRVARSMRDPLVLVLLGALLLTLVTGDAADAAVIGVVILVNTAIGLQQDVKSDRAVRALSGLAATHAWVVRAGQTREIPVTDVVPGDLVRLRQGDLVPADAVLVEGTGVEVDESTVTGESYPVDKLPATDPGSDPPATAGAENAQARLLSGTVVLRGRGLARVIATGANSTVGRLASLMVTKPSTTPLQRRMARLSGQLAMAAVALSLAVLAVGVWQGQSLELMVLTTIALTVAAVPESLPLVVTISLALAARRMAARRAVIRHLAAVETLGSVTLLATDKTGTLTRGSMTVSDSWTPSPGEVEDLRRALVLCNDAAVDPTSGHVHGDPTESALLAAARRDGADVDDLRLTCPRVSETPFDSTRKTMTTVHQGADGVRFALHKGAPETLLAPGFLADAPDVVERARERCETWAADGMRVIAVAEQALGSARGPRIVAASRLLGLVALVDPLRDSSAATIAQCRKAGLRVVLVTGDHAATAEAVASRVGITGGRTLSLAGATKERDGSGHIEAGVIARATPADKYALVGAFQKAGQVVAMTGDGVNDAPALRAADIGVAMGIRGTEVARQAADLVLMDDDLGTLVVAIREGRRVYDNIRRFLVYGLSGGCSEVLLMLAGPAVGIPLPLLPAQILWLNLLTHSFAGAGLASQPATRRVLERGPRPPEQGPLADGLWWRTLVIAAYLASATLLVLAASPDPVAHSAALLTLGAGQLAVAWGMRTTPRRHWRPGDPVDPLVPALAGAGILLTASTALAPLRDLLGTQVVGPGVWATAAVAALGAGVLARVLRRQSL